MLKIKRILSKKGFSLIELMVAVAILGIAALGIFQAYTTSFQAMADSKDRTVATNIAQKKLEEVKNSLKVAYPYYSIEYPMLSGKTFTVIVVTNPKEDNLEQVIVTVSWKNRKGVVKDVQLQTLVYDLVTTIVNEPDVGRIHLSADPTEITCCVEGETSAITAELFNTADQMVPSGTPVSFQVNNGSVNPEFTVTDAIGKVTTQLTINGLSPAAHVTVTATSGLVVSVPLEVTCIPEAAKIDLSANPSSILPGSSSTITATVTDTCGSVISKVTVGFNTDGKGTLSASTAITDSNGKATVTLSSMANGDTAIVSGTVTLSGGKTITDSTTVICTNYSISVSAAPTSITPVGSSIITATLTQSGGSIPTGEISFTTDKGTFENGKPTITTETTNGEAIVSLSSLVGGEIATITATYNISGNGSISSNTTVKCTEYIINITAEPNKILPGGHSTITATLTDYHGTPASGKLVEFSTTKGVLMPLSNSTNGSGIATTTLTLSNIGDIAEVSATFGYSSAIVSVPCIDFILTIPSVVPPSISPGESSVITALLTDHGGIAQNGKTITFTTNKGSFGNGLLTITATTVNGQAVVSLTLASIGTATVTATYTSVNPVFEISATTTVTCKLKKDFKVIHGNNIILSGRNTLTLTNGVDYTLEPGVTTEDCFVRIVNTRLTGIGRTLGGGSQNLYNYTVQISNPGNILTSFNLERVGSLDDCRVTWEILQYIGAEGGANEIKVRTAVGGLSTTAISVDGPALSNISNKNKAVIYITGQSGSNNGVGRWNECLFTSDFAGSSPNWIPRFTRGRAIDTGRVSYAVIEFTGSNWRNIQRIPFNSNGSTVTIPTSLLNTTKTFLHCQYRYVTTNDSGLDDCGETVEVFSTTQLKSRRRTSTDASLKYHVVWVMENTQSTGNYMIVQHISETRIGTTGLEEHVWSEVINGVRALDEVSIQGETLASAGTGTTYPRGSEGLVITFATNLNRIQSNMGQECDYAHCIVQFPSQ